MSSVCVDQLPSSVQVSQKALAVTKNKCMKYALKSQEASEHLKSTSRPKTVSGYAVTAT